MAGGGAGFSGENGQGSASPESGYEGSPQGAQSPYASSQDIYSQLTQPSSGLINDIYQHSLGRTPETEGANWWANAAQGEGWNAQQLAQAINAAGAPERERTGYTSNLNPQNYGTQKVGTQISSFNTNPYAVDYANIFNPRAGQVAVAQPVMAPQQQAQYLSDWANDYSTRNRAATTAANQQRIATANTQWNAYLQDKAAREGQAAIDAAVAAKEAEWRRMYSGNSDSGSFYTGASGGSVPGGLRSIRGK